VPVPPVLTPQGGYMLYHIDTEQGCLTLSLCLALGAVSMPESVDESCFDERK